MSTTTNSVPDPPPPGSAADLTSPPSGGAEPPCDPRDRQALRHAVLTAIWGETAPAKLPSLWSFLGTASCVRRLCCAINELAVKLRETFTIEQLAEVGAFELGGADGPKLNSKFGDASALMFIGKNKIRTDVLTPLGSVTCGVSPAVERACIRAEEGDRKPERLLVAGSNEDVGILHRLGFQSIWSSGLERITGAEVRRLFTQDVKYAFRRKYRMTLVGWQVSSLIAKPAPAIEKILNRFSEMSGLYEFDPELLFDVWSPASGDIDSVKTAVSFQDPEIIRTICNRSIAHSTISPAEALAAFYKPPDISYASAHAQLVGLLERARKCPGPFGIQNAVEQFRQAFRKSVMQGLYEQAEASKGSSEALLLFMVAGLASDWFERQRILEAARQALTSQSPNYEKAAFGDDLKELFPLIDKILKILNELPKSKPARARRRRPRS